MSNHTKGITRIYTGPVMIANGLIARLQELGISPITRNDHKSATLSGFAAGIPGQVMLFLRKDQLTEAQPIIDAYIKEVEE